MSWTGELRAVALAVILVTAGCAGIGGDATERAGTVPPALAETPTVSPTPTATPSPTATPTPTFAEGLPPGVRPDGVDAETLAAAHRGEVSLFSRTTLSSLRFTATNGTVLGVESAKTEVEFVTRRTRVLVTVTTSGTAPESVGVSRGDATYWGNGTVSAVRRVTENGTRLTFSRTPLPPVIRADTTGESVVFLAFSSVNLTSVERAGTDDGRRLYRLRGAADNVSLLRGFDVSLVATVDEIGIVRSLRFAYTTTRDGVRVRVERRFRLADFKNTTAPPPDWVATARNESTR